MPHIGKFIRNSRQELGMTILQLAYETGCGETTIAECEKGRRDPSWRVILGLIDCIGVDFLQDYIDAMREEIK